MLSLVIFANLVVTNPVQILVIVQSSSIRLPSSAHSDEFTVTCLSYLCIKHAVILLQLYAVSSLFSGRDGVLPI